MQAWSRHLSSPEGKQGLLYLRLNCPKMPEKTDDALIKNAIGFEFWQAAIEAIVKLGDVPAKPEKQEDDALEHR